MIVPASDADLDQWFSLVAVFYDDTNISYLLFIYGAIIFLMWFKILLLLRISPLLGPMIRMMSKMIKDMFIFFLLYTLIIIFFSVIGQCSFMDVPEFNTFGQSMLYLFNSSLGNYEFAIFDGIMRATFGYIFLVIY